MKLMTFWCFWNAHFFTNSPFSQFLELQFTQSIFIKYQKIKDLALICIHKCLRLGLTSPNYPYFVEEGTGYKNITQ